MTDTTDFEAMEKDGWADPAIANGYAMGFDRATRLVAKNLADSVASAVETEVLDLCCGHGVVTAELVARGANVTGLDFSASMISLAEVAVPDAMFIQGDAMAMAFADASFDAVTIGFGVPHFPDPAKGLAEAARVLRPGGRLAFSIWHGKGSDGAFGWLFDAVGRLGDPSVTLPDGPDAHQYANADLAASVMTSAGFGQIEISQVSSELWIAKPEDLYDTFNGGAVRAASLLGGQPRTAAAAIRADLANRVRQEGTETDDGYLVPAPSVVVSATRD